ncbi:unnamed protein product [Ectocarpus sp. CCAP 1310/34]|nr:unnamed protein product [Ectocarpus sp. CCAP 1310/34]
MDSLNENGELPLSGLMKTCFNMMFPEKAVDLFVQKTNKAFISRDLFEMLYCRFIHCSDGNAPPRLLDEDNTPNPDFDSKWHIGELEDILNTAWTENMDFNQWLCYDEQMVKTVSRYAHFLIRHQPKKPITHGMKMLAICDVEGYCFVSSVDGGFSGDPKLRAWSDCPLGLWDGPLGTFYMSCSAPTRSSVKRSTVLACTSQ